MEKRRLKSQILLISQVDESLEEALWSVFSKYYDSISRAAFHSDLRKKTHVIVLSEEDTNTICGFSTAEVYFSQENNRKVQVIFSGDTIMEKAYWGRKNLHRAFFRLLVTLKIKHPFTPLYWFLLSKGYKTYLTLAKNVVNFWPRPFYQASESEQALLDQLASEKFGDYWKKDLGVLQFDQCPGRLKENVTPISNKDLEDIHIRFFQEKNVFHARGDELCCIARIDIQTVRLFLSKNLKRIAINRSAMTLNSDSTRLRDVSSSDSQFAKKSV